MKSVRALIVKNASANVVRGLATAAVALLLPHFLTHALDTDRFAAWSLILQIASYASFLDFGLQTAVARFFAQAAETGDSSRRNALVSTAILLLSIAALLALGVIAAVLWQASRLFPGVPPTLFAEFRGSALLLACGSCLLLPLSTYTGVLIGMHRNEIPAVAIGFSRLAGALAVLAAVRFTHSLIVLAACITVANLAGSLAQGVAVKHLLPSLRVRLQDAQRRMAGELFRYCFGLSIWAFSMLLVSGLDLSIVGHFQFASVGVYSIAATLSLFYAGLNQSVVSALMTPLAALHAQGRVSEIRSLVLRATRLNAFANVAVAAVLILFGPALLRAWVGQTYAQAAYPLVCLLVLAQVVRLLLNPYGAALVAIGRQGRALLPAILEALVNLTASVAGMMLFGAIGVAAGTLAGACVGAAVLLIHTVPRVQEEMGLSRKDLVLQA